MEANQKTVLKVDYSNFKTHCFFDSAAQKFTIAQNKILNNYPYNGSSEEVDLYYSSGSGYEAYVTDNLWPSYAGYLTLDGLTQYISASDTDSYLFPGSSSIYVSAWVNPVINRSQYSSPSY